MTSRTAHSTWMAGGLAAALTLLWFVAASDAAMVQPLRSDPEALKLLHRASDSARHTAFQGRQFVTNWSRTGTSATAFVTVEHMPGKGTSLTVNPTTAGKGGKTFEADNPAESPGGLNGYTPEMLSLLSRNYSVTRAGEGKVCGRTTTIVEARRADGSAVGRFWIDKEKGLILRRDLLDKHGHATAIVFFSSISFAKPKIDNRVLLASGTSQPWGRELSSGELTALRGEGWSIPDRLPGGLSLYGARKSLTDGVLHLSYSDGLSAISVFVQRGQLDESRFAAWGKNSRGGSTVYVRDTVQLRSLWASHGYVYTVVADGPPDTVEAAVKALPHGQPGFWDRLGRGMSRVTTWANPFS